MKIKFDYDHIFDVCKQLESFGYTSFFSDFSDATEDLEGEEFEIMLDPNKPENWVITDYK